MLKQKRNPIKKQQENPNFFWGGGGGLVHHRGWVKKRKKKKESYSKIAGKYLGHVGYLVGDGGLLFGRGGRRKEEKCCLSKVYCRIFFKPSLEKTYKLNLTLLLDFQFFSKSCSIF